MHFRYFPRTHVAVTCVQPNGFIGCMSGEGACVSNMQVVTVLFDEKNLGIRARIANMTTKIMTIAKSCSCRIEVGSAFCPYVSYKLDDTCRRKQSGK